MMGKDKLALGEVLKALITSTTIRFKYEEDQLARNGYPDMVGHRNEHVELSARSWASAGNTTPSARVR